MEPGHSRAVRRRVRRLPHAVPARRRAEDQRPPRAEPAAEHRPRVPDVPSMVGGRAAARVEHDSGPDVRDAERRDGRARALIADIKAARDAARPTRSSRPLASYQRRGQFLLDFVEAENSMGFHAGQEAVRVLARSIDFTRQGQIAVRDSLRAQCSSATPGQVVARGTTARNRDESQRAAAIASRGGASRRRTKRPCRMRSSPANRPLP